MIDFHSHVLPGVDDGSKSVDESLEMLRLSASQGIEVMCATPHFYPTEDDPGHFLRRRAKAWQKLSEAMSETADDKMPRVVLGAEVYYFAGISRSDIVDDLRIGNTELLLLEMPFSRWTQSMVNEIVALGERYRITVVLAHIERYLKYQEKRTWDFLLANDILMQSNADFFLNRRSRHKAEKMLRSGMIHIMGSDCHNTGDRPPKMGEALAVLGDDGRRILKRNIKNVLIRCSLANKA